MIAESVARDCPVLTCSNKLMAEAIMCASCYGALATFERVALDKVTKDVRRQPTMRNKQRFTQAVADARAAAARRRA